MRYFVHKEGGHILTFGAGQGFEEINEEQYTALLTAMENRPDDGDGYTWRLKEDLTWKKIDAPVEESEPEADEDTLEAVELFPRWSETSTYATGDRVRYGELLYKCLIDHQAQATWTPDAAPSLWVRVDNPEEEWPEWRQPVGSADAYALGAKVSHNEKHWISTVDGNVWEPGVFGWDEA